MGTNGTGNPILLILLLCVVASLALAAIGFAMRRRGKLATQGAAMGWAILTILPLFGAGAAMFGKHEVEHATGVTQDGVNANDVRSAP